MLKPVNCHCSSIFTISTVVVIFRLDDLSRAAYYSNVDTQRELAGIFLELVFAKEIRDQIASMNTPGKFIKSML